MGHGFIIADTKEYGAWSEWRNCLNFWSGSVCFYCFLHLVWLRSTCYVYGHPLLSFAPIWDELCVYNQFGKSALRRERLGVLHDSVCTY
jgi:hypothetical protein